MHLQFDMDILSVAIILLILLLFRFQKPWIKVVVSDSYCKASSIKEMCTWGMLTHCNLVSCIPLAEC